METVQRQEYEQEQDCSVCASSFIRHSLAAWRSFTRSFLLRHFSSSGLQPSPRLLRRVSRADGLGRLISDCLAFTAAPCSILFPRCNDVTLSRFNFCQTHGNVAPACALVVLTSVLVITPLAFTSFRKLDESTGAATRALTKLTSVLLTAPLPLTSPRRTAALLIASGKTSASLRLNDYRVSALFITALTVTWVVYQFMEVWADRCLIWIGRLRYRCC